MLLEALFLVSMFLHLIEKSIFHTIPLRGFFFFPEFYMGNLAGEDKGV